MNGIRSMIVELAGRHRLRRVLATFDEHQLRDIGLDLGAARAEACRAWWEPIDWRRLAPSRGPGSGPVAAVARPVPRLVGGPARAAAGRA